MADEGQEIQNEEIVTPPAAESPAEETVTPDSQPTGETPAEAPIPDEDKEAKKERDFEKGMYKFRDLYKAKDDEVGQLRRELEEIKSRQNQPDTPPEEQEALGILRKLFAEEIAPIKEELSSVKEEKIWDKFESDPIVRTLGPEVKAELDNLDPALKSLPLEQRLNTAKALAIANNLPTIQKAYKDLGIEQAYTNQAVKRGQSGLGQSPSQMGPKPESVVDRVLRGETVTTEEFAAHEKEIDEAMRRQIRQ